MGWKPIPTRPGYSIALGIVCIFVLLVPLLYFAIVGAIGWGVYWHLVSNVPDFGSLRPRAGIAMAILYAVPAAVGLIVVLVMLKPLFARPSDRGETIKLEQFEEIQLHSFVENVCTVIGAPVPKEIHLSCDVNASASFQRGILSLFSRGDLVLTIGMPLVAGMSKRELAGVLAHEFGHFAQGAAMRSGYLLGVVSRWIGRAAFERDHLDVWIADMIQTGELLVRLFAITVAGCIWIVRLILKGMALMVAMAYYLLGRQMEYDADRYEVQVAGSKTFETTFQRIYELNGAVPRAMEEARRLFLRDRHLPDDFPTVIAEMARRLTPEDKLAIAERLRTHESGMLSAHPASRSRIQQAMKLNQPGLYTDDGPATELFGDFEAASKKATYGLWRGIFGEDLFDVTFVPVAKVIKTQSSGAFSDKMSDAIVAYLGVAAPTWRPSFLSISQLPEEVDFKGMISRIKHARTRLKDGAAAAQAAAEQYRIHSEELVKWEQAKRIQEGGLEVEYKAMGLKPMPQKMIGNHTDQLRESIAGSAGTIDEFGELGMQRLSAALAMLNASGIERIIPDAASRRGRVNGLLKAMRTQKELQRKALQVRQCVLCADAMAPSVKSKETFEKAKEILRRLTDDIRDTIADARELAGATPDPYSTAEYGSNMGEALVGATPAWRDFDEILANGRTFVERYCDYNRQVLADLVTLAQDTERSVAKALQAKQQQTSA